MITFDEFIAKYNGKFDEEGGSKEALNQCVDLANGYISQVLGNPKILWTDAGDFPSKADKKLYTFIPNTPTAVPQKGDIMVWKKDKKNNLPVGHISVFIYGNVNSFTSFDQNWPLNTPCHKQTHSYNGVAGWLRPNKNTMKFVEVLRYNNAPTVYGIVAFETMDEVSATGLPINLMGPPSLIKEYGNPEVSLKYAIPTFDSVKYLGLTPEKNMKEDTRSNDIKNLNAQIKKLKDQLKLETNLHNDTKKSSDEIIIELKKEIEGLNTQLTELQGKLKDSEQPENTPTNPQEVQIQGFIAKIIEFIRKLVK